MSRWLALIWISTIGCGGAVREGSGGSHDGGSSAGSASLDGESGAAASDSGLDSLATEGDVILADTATPSCGDTNSDIKNCGICGHDCLGGMCSAGACLPVMLFSTSNGYPSEIALDSTRVYWTDTESDLVMSVPKDGGTATQLANSGRPTAIAVGANALYWVTQFGGLWRLQQGSTMPAQLAPNGDESFGLALTDSAAYWTDLSGIVAMLPLSGGSVVQMATGQNVPAGIVVGPASLYWLDLNTTPPMGTTSLVQTPLDGGPPNVVVPTVEGQSSGLDAIAIDRSYVYFTTAGSLFRLPLSGGQPEPLASALRANSLAVDDSGIYVATRFEILKVPLGGGIAQPMVGQLFNPRGIAVDPAAVYYTDVDVVMKIAK